MDKKHFLNLGNSGILTLSAEIQSYEYYEVDGEYQEKMKKPSTKLIQVSKTPPAGWPTEKMFYRSRTSDEG